jgi:phenylpropionate dioxygenase-like ring-hydroxylating dioxygenase large terminal subunit
MRHERQVELLRRVQTSGDHLRGLHAPASSGNRADAYTDPERFELERRVLFRGGPVFFGLSADLTEPGDFRAMRVDGIPIVVVRQPDGSLGAFVNACRHRGAPLVDPASTGSGLRAFNCPYHAWSYGLDGGLRARPVSAGAFDDVTADCSLLRRPVAERYGMIFVRAEGDEPIDVDEFLSGAEDDLAAFGLEDYVHIESRTNEWNMNWKLFFDTFSESYHIRTLHRDSIAPAFNSDCVIFDGFGRNLLSVGLRANVRDEFDKPESEWSLLPYGTIQYFLVPNGLVVHQLDHFEVWIVEPLSVGRTRTTTSVYAPAEPESDKARAYFVRNLDLLLQVTGSEDFTLMSEIQQSLASGALPELVYGRIEPPLVHFHEQVNLAIGALRS